jgi:hypothetical protein
VLSDDSPTRFFMTLHHLVIFKVPNGLLQKRSPAKSLIDFLVHLFIVVSVFFSYDGLSAKTTRFKKNMIFAATSFRQVELSSH